MLTICSSMDDSLSACLKGVSLVNTKNYSFEYNNIVSVTAVNGIHKPRLSATVDNEIGQTFWLDPDVSSVCVLPWCFYTEKSPGIFWVNSWIISHSLTVGKDFLSCNRETKWGLSSNVVLGFRTAPGRYFGGISTGGNSIGSPLWSLQRERFLPDAWWRLCLFVLLFICGCLY